MFSFSPKNLEDILGEYITAAGRILERWRVTTKKIDPVTDALTSASSRQTQLFGPQPGKGIERHKGPAPTSTATTAPYLSVQAAGFSLNAAVYVSADEGDALERLCRYIARPPVSNKRLQLLEDGRVVLQLRRPWADGTKELVFDPLDFIGRLASLIPTTTTHYSRSGISGRVCDGHVTDPSARGRATARDLVGAFAYRTVLRARGAS